MLDAVETVSVLVQPGQRADRARREQEAVGVPQPTLEQLLREHRRDRDPERLSLASDGWQT